MRWKLLLIVSLIASIVGSGAAIAIILFLSGTASRLEPNSIDLIALSPLIIPVAIVIVAGIFVYRHTARRRKLQAMATVLLSAILLLTLFFVSMMLLRKKEQPQPPTPQPVKIAFRSGSILEPLALSQANSLFDSV